MRQTIRSNYRSARAYDENSRHNITDQNDSESRKRIKLINQIRNRKFFDQAVFWQKMKKHEEATMCISVRI